MIACLICTDMAKGFQLNHVILQDQVKLSTFHINNFKDSLKYSSDLLINAIIDHIDWCLATVCSSSQVQVNLIKNLQDRTNFRFAFWFFMCPPAKKLFPTPLAWNAHLCEISTLTCLLCFPHYPHFCMWILHSTSLMEGVGVKCRGLVN